ncbi:MAG: hypothetical protein JXA82_12075 [Sedimentisphaerales bacterium]|nr:hypothetical protein [Sedimentisphaerales bacterium]
MCKSVSFILLALGIFSGATLAGTVLTDAQWLSATRHDQVTSITDLAGDPGLSIEVTKTDSTGISILQLDFGGADLSANGDTFEVELENPTDTGFNINAFGQSGGWAWTQDWAWLGAGQTRIYTVTLSDPTSVDRLGFQLHADAGNYTINIRGGVVDFSPSDPNPADGARLGVLIGGNRLKWVNHSTAYPETGEDVLCDVYIGTDPNALLTDPVAMFEDVANMVTVELTDGQRYYWTVNAYEPDGSGGFILHEGPIWQFDAVKRFPSTRYQAEDGTIVAGDTSPERRNDAAASGGKIIWTNWSGTDRGYFFWKVMAPDAGDYEMTVHYAISGTSERGDKIQINDVSASDTMFPGTDGVYGDLVVPITLEKGINTISIVTSWGGISYDYFEIDMDDLTATHPHPAIDEVVLVGDNSLSWTKHSLFDPEQASDVLCDVYLGTTEPNLAAPDYDLPVVASGTVENSIPVTLEWGNTYYWVVDSLVPVDTNDVPFKGFVWTFTTVDPAPVIELDMAKTAKRTVPVRMEPVVTDLGKPGLSYAWTIETGPAGITIESICDDPTALDPTFLFDVIGTYNLALTVTDESGNAPSATIEVHVVEYFRSLRLEAEDATIIAGDTSPEIRMDDNASDNRIVWSTWSGTDRGSIEFEVMAPYAGVFDMTIRYRVDGAGARGDKIRVNGEPQSAPDTMFPPTSGLYEDYKYENVTLNEGLNTIEFDTSWGGIWYDYIEFFDIVAPRQAYEPNPKDWSQVPATLTELSWRIDPNSPSSVIASEVYIGTSEPNALLPDYGMTRITADTSMSLILTETLAENTTYYWLVEYTDSELPGEVFQSRTWQFTALPPCEFFALVGDLDTDCDVDIEDLRILAGAWLTEDGYVLLDLADLAAHWKLCIDPVTGEPTICP